MSRTLALRQEMTRILEEIDEKAYYERAPRNRPYPYIVFSLNEVMYGEGKTTYQLEVNVLDRGDDSAVAELMADQIQTVLDQRYEMTKELQFTVYRGLRQAVMEEEKDIVRRRMLFEVHLHERSAK